MKHLRNYYENLRYPLQDKVLSVLNDSCSLYLTGGTAISRAYYNHRYSDDLVFFSINLRIFSFNWQEIIAKAKHKDLWFDEIEDKNYFQIIP